MKKITILSLSALFLFGCSNASQQTASTTATNAANSSVSAANATKPATDNSGLVSSHSTEKSTATKPAGDAPPMGSPNQKAIDVTEMTAKIEKADKDLKAKPNDEGAKKALAAAYFERAFALTNAAQYRVALGDFRKGLKLDPTNADAKSMHDQIISIFESMGREVPKEGEEPPPMSGK